MRMIVKRISDNDLRNWDTTTATLFVATSATSTAGVSLNNKGELGDTGTEVVVLAQSGIIIIIIIIIIGPLAEASAPRMELKHKTETAEALTTSMDGTRETISYEEAREA